MNGEIVVAERSLLALAVDPVGSPLFSGPFDYIYSCCPLDWMVCGELVDFRPLACAQVFQSRKPAFFVWQSRLIQSFDVDSAKAPPDVWLKRLGSSAAAQRWQSSDGQRWWMVWLQDGAPLLVLASTEASEPSRVSSSFPDVELLFADELHRKSFFSSLPSRPSTPSSVENQCIDRLSQSTAVAWNPSGLSSVHPRTACFCVAQRFLWLLDPDVG